MSKSHRQVIGLWLAVSAIGLSAAISQGCGSATEMDTSADTTLYYGALRKSALEHVHAHGLDRGESFVLAALQDSSSDEVAISRDGETHVGGWQVSLNRRTMNKVFLVGSVEVISVTIVFSSLQPKPSVKTVNVIVGRLEPRPE